MDNRPPPFNGQTRYALVINDSPVQPDVLMFTGHEALSEPFHWTIDFTTPQANISPEQVLMKYATLHMRSGRAVHGIITRLEWISTTADQSHYRAVLSARLALLAHTRQCRVFQNRSVPEVVEQVLRGHGLEGADFDFRLERSYLRQKALTGTKATTRVRFFWRQDEQGNMRVYSVHTGEGTPYEGVRTANMVWNSEHNRYEFTPAHGADGPLITWTPQKPVGSVLPSHTGSDIKPIDQWRGSV